MSEKSYEQPDWYKFCYRWKRRSHLEGNLFAFHSCCWAASLYNFSDNFAFAFHLLTQWSRRRQFRPRSAGIWLFSAYFSSRKVLRRAEANGSSVSCSCAACTLHCSRQSMTLLTWRSRAKAFGKAEWEYNKSENVNFRLALATRFGIQITFASVNIARDELRKYFYRARSYSQLVSVSI